MPKAQHSRNYRLSTRATCDRGKFSNGVCRDRCKRPYMYHPYAVNSAEYGKCVFVPYWYNTMSNMFHQVLRAHAGRKHGTKEDIGIIENIVFWLNTLKKHPKGSMERTQYDAYAKFFTIVGRLKYTFLDKHQRQVVFLWVSRKPAKFSQKDTDYCFSMLPLSTKRKRIVYTGSPAQKTKVKPPSTPTAPSAPPLPPVPDGVEFEDGFPVL
jgi:hypothetical protein